MEGEFHFRPIGYLRGGGQYPQEAPRQGVYADNRGIVELLAGENFEQAAADLAGFDRIWLLFIFDRNYGKPWKPLVRPPGMERRIGFLATRSPHRPNPIGMSAVELEKVEGRFLHIRNFDLLDGTPILDVKPYLPLADSFPESKAGWRDDFADQPIELRFTEEAKQAAGFLRKLGGPDLENLARVQLANRRLNPEQQRLKSGELAFRTWRLRFEESANSITVTALVSGYTLDELAPGAPDPYGDKELHRQFHRR